jgi:hypothetical protein
VASMVVESDKGEPPEALPKGGRLHCFQTRIPMALTNPGQG